MEPEKEQQTIRRAGAGPKLATALFVAGPLTVPLQSTESSVTMGGWAGDL